MVNKWLFKSDPEHDSYADLTRDRQTVWDGIANNLALKHLRNVRRGDEVMIYHSGGERSVVGLAEVLSDPYPDPQKSDPRLVVVDIRERGRLQRPVSLDEIKKQPELKDFDLVRLPRLSVMPVPAKHWKALLALSKA